MIGLSLRDGMDAVAFIEAVRFGVWAKLICVKEGKLGYRFLRAWCRVQEAMRGMAVNPLAPPEHFRLYLCDALQEAGATMSEAIEALTRADLTAGTAASIALRQAYSMANDATRTPTGDPGKPPPAVGTHRSKKKEGKT
jgi:hypothetical protein